MQIPFKGIQGMLSRILECVHIVCACIYIYIHIFFKVYMSIISVIHICRVHLCIYIYIDIYMGNGISPLAFCDICKSHEFRV